MTIRRLPELTLAFSKFGVLGPDDLVSLLDGRFGRSQAYRHLADLWKLKMVRRRAHSWSRADAFEATSELLERTHQKSSDAFRPLKEGELLHRIASVKALIALCKRAFVSGVALEHELGKEELHKFCPDRIPDGIVQITQPGSNPVEFALEVELTAKARPLAEEILNHYEKVFRNPNHQCRGLILVAAGNASHALYSGLLEKRSESFRDWVLFSNDLSLNDINENTLGQCFKSAQDHPRKPCETRRIATQNGVKYLNDFLNRPRIKGHRGVAGQSTARQETNE